MYVTLEPCNHYGKTPPCTDLIIKERIARVVIGMKDPNPIVNGKGILKLKKAGITVDSGILKKDIIRQNEVYTTFIKKKRPFFALKTAMTLDGKISTFTGDSKWISNEKSRSWAHELRHRYSGIMVGVNTIIKDNPMLTDRSTHKMKSNPLRIVVDSAGRTPLNSNVLDTSISHTMIAVTKKASKEFIDTVKQKGVEILVCPEKDTKVDLNFFAEKLAGRGIDSVLLEGGSTLNFSAIRDGIVDKVYSFISPKMFGGEKANTPLGGVGFEKVDDAITLSIEKVKRFDEDIMVEASIIKK
ncbi:MAG: bifunctional diaminohydroxyphosphoribosylaminopyrimidine deaminase/5-amino-6-(5-phosphoribosylamino)uracil reductase RibD [Bacteroidales bacterium]